MVRAIRSEHFEDVWMYCIFLILGTSPSRRDHVFVDTQVRIITNFAWSCSSLLLGVLVFQIVGDFGAPEDSMLASF